MLCRYCQKYIGNKIDLEDYFFWCDKNCHDQYEDFLLNPPEVKSLIERKSIIADETLVNTKKRTRKSNAAKIVKTAKNK